MVYAQLSLPVAVHTFTVKSVAIIQPLLIFSMLFLSFCKVDPRKLKLYPWHIWLVLIQIAIFFLLGGLLLFFPDMNERVVVERAMICMICPTATAAIVVTDKLGGSSASLTTYTIMSNLVTALIVPLLLPIVHPVEGMSFLSSFWAYIEKSIPAFDPSFFCSMDD